MRIRKRWPLHTLTRFAHPSPDLQSQEEKKSTTAWEEAPPTLYCTRCFAVVEENRRIGWPYNPSNQSHNSLREEDSTASNPQLMINRETNSSIHSNHMTAEQGPCLGPNSNPLEGRDGEKDAEEKKLIMTTSNQSSGSGASVALAIPSSSSRQVVEGWSEGEKIIPLKKRRGRYAFLKTKETTTKKENNMKTKVKTDTTKKRSDEEKEDENDEDVYPRRRKRSNVLMEGSRCSRVNGRGWRCNQITLVGYSLCQHHLGQARIRSISSIDSCA